MMFLCLVVVKLRARWVRGGRSPLHDSAAAASAVLLANAKSRMLPYHAVGLPVRRTGLTIVLGEG